MRWLLSFFSGLTSGLAPNASVRTFRAPKVDIKSALSKVRPIAFDVMARLFLLTGAIALAWLAIRSAESYRHPGNTQASAVTLPNLMPAAPLSVDEVLATDPAAPARQWKYIVIHHSASFRGSAQSFDRAHRERGWRCLGYHFVIGNGTDQGEGEIVAGPRWYSQEAGAHANSAEYNEHGIGICLVGNFDLQPPSPRQMNALRELLRRLCKRYGIPPRELVGHNQIRRGGSTACPGKLFPLAELRDSLE